MDSELFYPQRGFAFPPERYADFEKAKVVVLPIPYDSTTDWRAGAREGPNAIIDASHFMEPYDCELEREPYTVGIHTLPELQPSMEGPQQTVERVYKVTGELLEKGKFVVMLGGEHSLTIGTVRAYRERYDKLSVLQLDAHADLRDQYEGSRYGHACVMRRVIEMCPVVQVGARSMSREEREFVDSEGLRPFYAGGATIDNDAVVSALTDDVYISIDLDVFDPSIMSAVGTPEPGGMGWHEVVGLLTKVAEGKRIVGFDIVELAPREGPATCAFLAARLAYRLIGLAVQP
jgi:agmatinase